MFLHGGDCRYAVVVPEPSLERCGSLFFAGDPDVGHELVRERYSLDQLHSGIRGSHQKLTRRERIPRDCEVDDDCHRYTSSAY